MSVKWLPPSSTLGPLALKQTSAALSSASLAVRGVADAQQSGRCVEGRHGTNRRQAAHAELGPSILMTVEWASDDANVSKSRPPATGRHASWHTVIVHARPGAARHALRLSGSR